MAWPLGTTNNNFLKRNKKARHIASHLLAMEEDIQVYKSMSDSENEKRNLVYLSRLSNQYPNLALPTEPLPSPAPILGPYANEDRLEPVNRCWNTLQYFRFVQQAAGMWNLRLATAASVNQSVLVNESHVPAWMKRPEAASMAPTIRRDCSSSYCRRLTANRGTRYLGSPEKVSRLGRAAGRNRKGRGKRRDYTRRCTESYTRSTAMQDGSIL
jgi:hypothetical protein